MSSDFIILTCPSCGGKLEITNDLERFACQYCGNEQIVKRTGSIISLAPVLSSIKEIQNVTDKTASELAIVRLEKEIHTLQSQLNTMRVSVQKEKTESVQTLISIPIILLVVAFCAGIVLQDSLRKGELGSFLFIICGAIFFVLVIAGSIKGIFKRSDKHKERMLEAEISRKEAELQHHRQVVSRS